MGTELQVHVGLRPGATFGAAVNGMSDLELQQIRGVLGSALSPSHGGCSLTFKLALCGDPAWKASVAPALQWVSAVWSSINDSHTAIFGTAELTSRWNAARPLEASSWKHSTGPLQRTVLSLRRIGWEATNAFEWQDDLGRAIRLWEHSPNLICNMKRHIVANRMISAAVSWNFWYIWLHVYVWGL